MFLIPPAFPEEESLSLGYQKLLLNKKDFKELFVKRDAKILDGMVKAAIDNFTLRKLSKILIVKLRFYIQKFDNVSVIFILYHIKNH